MSKHNVIYMLETAQKAMVPPFQVSVMADPSGAFTTAVALVKKQLREKHGRDLSGACAVVLGGTGPIGIGALAVGDFKYKLQHALLRDLLRHEEPLFVDFREAFRVARNMLT